MNDFEGSDSTVGSQTWGGMVKPSTCMTALRVARGWPLSVHMHGSVMSGMWLAIVLASGPKIMFSSTCTIMALGCQTLHATLMARKEVKGSGGVGGAK